MLFLNIVYKIHVVSAEISCWNKIYLWIVLLQVQ